MARGFGDGEALFGRWKVGGGCFNGCLETLGLVGAGLARFRGGVSLVIGLQLASSSISCASAASLKPSVRLQSY